jgi:hypothetical protein
VDSTSGSLATAKATQEQEKIERMLVPLHAKLLERELAGLII